MNRYTWRTGILEAVMIIAALLFLVPVYILFNLAFRAAGDNQSPLALTTQPTLDNFGQAWERGNLANALINSTVVTVLSILILIIVSALAAYPLARITARWSRLAYTLFMLGLLLPMQLAFIPLYRTFLELQLLGTLWALIIFYAGLQVPFSVFLYTSFLRALPRDYEEAATLDGCRPWQAFFRVVFPLLGPVTGTVAALNTILVWNDFLTPLLYLSGSGTQTVPVSIYGFVGQYTTEWPIVFAGLVIGMIPILVAYFAMQGRVMRGFSSGLKG